MDKSRIHRIIVLKSELVLLTPLAVGLPVRIIFLSAVTESASSMLTVLQTALLMWSLTQNHKKRRKNLSLFGQRKNFNRRTCSYRRWIAKYSETWCIRCPDNTGNSLSVVSIVYVLLCSWQVYLRVLMFLFAVERITVAERWVCVTDAGFGDKTTLTGARSNADRSTGPWLNPCRRLPNTAGREIYGIQLRMTWSLQLLLLRSLRRVLMYV